MIDRRPQTTDHVRKQQAEGSRQKAEGDEERAVCLLPTGNGATIYGLRSLVCEEGSILIYVVWLVLLLSLFTAGVGSQALGALNVSDRLSEQLRAAYIARGAVQYAALAIEQDPTPTVDGFQEVWSDSPERFREHPLGAGVFSITAERPGESEPRYGLSDEDGRINLNTAPTKVLQRLLEAAGGLKEEDVLKVADSIEDWRDEDEDQRPSGAEGDTYRSRPEAYDCKDAPFENSEELLLVNGVSPELFRRIEPYVTVYGSGRINLNTAPEAVVRALGLSETGLAGFLAFRDGEDGLAGTSDDRLLASVNGLDGELGAFVSVEDIARLSQLAQDEVVTVRSEAFRMSVEARTDQSSSRIRMACIMDRDRRILFWEEK